MIEMVVAGRQKLKLPTEKGLGVKARFAAIWGKDHPFPFDQSQIHLPRRSETRTTASNMSKAHHFNSTPQARDSSNLSHHQIRRML
jgi:hypothetical protein